MRQNMMVTCTRDGRVFNPSISVPISIRGYKQVNPTEGECECCTDTIIIMEQYFYIGYAPYCLGCVEYS